jgi:hypothetical protein
MKELTKSQKEANKKLYDEVNDCWPLRKGKNEFLKHLSQGNLTRGEAIVAQCYHCCGGYESGPRDCEESVCTLYDYMPYRDLERVKVAMTDEAKAQLIKRLSAGRVAKAAV